MNKETTATAKLRDELHDIANELLATGYRVMYWPGKAGWIIIERNGNVGTVQYDSLSDYSVHFEVKPSRVYGSSLLVWGLNWGQGMGTIIDACKIATEPLYRNFATNDRQIQNHGMAHFDWCKDRLIELELAL